MVGYGNAQGRLAPADVERLLDQALDSFALSGRVVFLVPDLTRTCPIDLLFPLLYRRLAGRLEWLDFIVALGTHPPLSKAQIYRRFGITAPDHRTRFPRARFFNHAWDQADALTEIGRIRADELRRLTDGLFALTLPVRMNRQVCEADHAVVIGPVFPHEVVGFSGGNKYFFPGVSGPEVLHFFHWLGAVLTSAAVMGRKDTPVRRVVDRAAALAPVRRHALCLVVAQDGTAGLFAGPPEEAWSAAADLSAQVHIVNRDRPFHTVLSCAPPMYDELWVGGKCVYKVEPVVSDGGRLIVYAPHIRRISATHGERIRRLGYHVRDYYLAQWDRFRDEPWGVLAHSTHVKGRGTFEDGVESPRIEVTLATAIPEAVCRAVNLGYLDPGAIDPNAFRGRESEGVLLVEEAGEVLYRLGAPGAPPAPDRHRG